MEKIYVPSIDLPKELISYLKELGIDPKYPYTLVDIPNLAFLYQLARLFAVYEYRLVIGVGFFYIYKEKI